MGSLAKSMVKGSKWLGKNVLPILSYGYGPVVGAAVNTGVQALNKPGAPPSPTPMPVADEEELLRSRRRMSAATQQRSGRASTVLSDPGERLGP